MIELLQALSLPFLGFCLIAMTVAFGFMTFRDHSREREQERRQRAGAAKHSPPSPKGDQRRT